MNAFRPAAIKEPDNKEPLKHMIRDELFKTFDDKERIKLSSGKLSKYYFDVRKISTSWYPSKLIAYAYNDIIKKYVTAEVGKNITVGGIETGAIPIIMSLINEYQLQGFYLRKKPKKYGMMQQLEGNPSNQCILVDDVITTGKSILEYIEVLKRIDHHIKIIGVFPLIDRNKELENYDLFFQLKSKGIVYEPVFESLEFIKQKELDRIREATIGS